MRARLGTALVLLISFLVPAAIAEDTKARDATREKLRTVLLVGGWRLAVGGREKRLRSPANRQLPTANSI